MSCGIGCRCGSDLADMAWLWRRPVFTAPIHPEAGEPPHTKGSTPKKKKKKKNYLRMDHRPQCKVSNYKNFLKETQKIYMILGLAMRFLVLFFHFLGPHLWHMEVPRLGVESQLQPPLQATATATQDLISICNLHHMWLKATLDS